MGGFPYVSQDQTVQYSLRHGTKPLPRINTHSCKRGKRGKHGNFPRRSKVKSITWKVERNIAKVSGQVRKLAKEAVECYYEFYTCLKTLGKKQSQMVSACHADSPRSAKISRQYMRLSPKMSQLFESQSSFDDHGSNSKDNTSSLSIISPEPGSKRSSLLLQPMQTVCRFFLSTRKSKNVKRKISVRDISAPVLISSSIFPGHGSNVSSKSSPSTVRSAPTTIDKSIISQTSTSRESRNSSNRNCSIERDRNSSHTSRTLSTALDDYPSVRYDHSLDETSPSSISKRNVYRGYLDRSATVTSPTSIRMNYNRDKRNSHPILQTTSRNFSLRSTNRATSPPQSLPSFKEGPKHLQHQISITHHLRQDTIDLYSQNINEYRDSIEDLTRPVDNEVARPSFFNDPPPHTLTEQTRSAAIIDPSLHNKNSISGFSGDNQQYFMDEELVPRPLEPRRWRLSANDALGRRDLSAMNTLSDTIQQSDPQLRFREFSIRNFPSSNALCRISSLTSLHNIHPSSHYQEALVTDPVTDENQLPYTPDKEMSVDDMLGPIEGSWNPIGVRCLSCGHSCDPSPSNILPNKDRQLRALNTTYLPGCLCSLCNPLERAISEEEELEG